MGFLVFLLFVLLLWWLLRPFLRIFRAVKRTQQGFAINLNDFFGTPGAQNPAGEPRRRDGWSGRRVKKKKIAQDVGEYVAFSEVEVSETAGADARDVPKFTAEQQVTDVEWEDIK